MTKYRKKPIIIKAKQWNGNNIAEILGWIGENAYYKDRLYIKTLEGEHVASISDYIIKGIAGEFYPCKSDIFKETYEEI